MSRTLKPDSKMYHLNESFPFSEHRTRNTQRGAPGRDSPKSTYSRAGKGWFPRKHTRRSRLFPLSAPVFCFPSARRRRPCLYVTHPRSLPTAVSPSPALSRTSSRIPITFSCVYLCLLTRGLASVANCWRLAPGLLLQVVGVLRHAQIDGGVVARRRLARPLEHRAAWLSYFVPATRLVAALSFVVLAVVPLDLLTCADALIASVDGEAFDTLGRRRTA